MARPRSGCAFHKDSGSHAFDLPPSETSRWRAVARVLRSTGDVVACTFLPDNCSLCGLPLPRLSFTPICDSCWAQIRGLEGTACVRCADALDSTSIRLGKTLCRRCRLAPPMFEKAVSFAPYDGRMREAIHELKFERRRSTAARLAEMLAGAIAELEDEAPAEMLVVPVPLHRSRLRTRGFNQTRLLAVRALDLLARSHPAWKLTLAPQVLVRTRATVSQVQLTPHGRRVNLRGAFRVPDAALLDGRDVLLLDDILTTGATARMAAEALRKAGAKSVWVATVARARHFSYDAAADEAAAGKPMQVQDRQSFHQPSS